MTHRTVSSFRLDIDRRTFFGGAAATAGVVCGGFASMQGATAQTLRQRQSVAADKAAKDLATYRRAVETMLGLGYEHPHNWYRQALIHLIDCPHGNWWFLPWHRGYLASFEAICAKHGGDPDFALPFWDWTAAPEVPSVFYGDVLDPLHASFEKDPEKLASGMKPAIEEFLASATPVQKDWLERRGVSDAETIVDLLTSLFGSLAGGRNHKQDSRGLRAEAVSEVRDAAVREDVRQKEFALFGSFPADDHYAEALMSGTLETGPHSSVHMSVLGMMGDMMSPVDPLFWTHHCNIDRLWSIWLRKQKNGVGQELNPTASAWLDEPFPFFVAPDEKPLDGKTCKDFSDETALGYGYGPGSLDDMAQISVTAVSAPSAVIASVAINENLRAFRETAGAISLDPSVLKAASAPVAAASEPARDLLARITISPPKDQPNLRIRVFANCPYLSAFTPLTDPHYVGAISFFGARHAGHHGSGEVSYLLPLDPTLRTLRLKRRSVQKLLKLQFLAVDESDNVRELDSSLAKIELIGT